MRPVKPKKRHSPKRAPVRFAEEIESLFINHEDGRLDESMAERAQLISDILFDLSNESGVNATHPQLVKAYVLAIQDVLPELSGHDYEEIQTGFKQIRELMNGCSQARYEQIDTFYHGSQEERMQMRELEFGILARSEMPQARETEYQNDELAAVRDKLLRLEALPENEAERFRLETEIYNLEHQRDQWPDVIGGGDDGSE